MRELVPLCHRYGTLVIADEVASGMGRTGKFFASELYDLEPDLMCLAKALGSGVAPIATTLATKELADAVAEDLHFYSTFGWMPLATEAALGTLDYWDDHGDELLENVAARASQLCGGLMRIFEDAEEVRVQGMAVAVEIGDEDAVSRIVKRCRDAGLIVIEEEDTLMMLPPLTVDEQTVEQALEILERAS
jgi:acetylornithine/succinyldiaminopimelate/putrescine aminotransferase